MPKLAIAVVADQYRAIERLVACLREQDVRDQLELVVAAPSGESFALPELADLARASVVEVESGRMIDNELHRELLLSRADEQLGAAP